MSDIENRKIQDVLREVADGVGTSGTTGSTITVLREALGVKDAETWALDLASCLREIADRIDRQSVVEVQVPPKPKLEPDSDQPEPAELEALTPAIIDVHDCIIDVHIHGGIDDQD